MRFSRLATIALLPIAFASAQLTANANGGLPTSAIDTKSTVPKWLIGKWRVAQSSMQSELARAKTWDSGKYLGLVAFLEAAANLEVSAGEQEVRVKALNQDREGTVVAFKPDNEERVYFSYHDNPPVMVENVAGDVLVTVDYAGEKIQLIINKADAFIPQAMMPEWMQGKWVLDKAATLEAYKALNRPEEPPAIVGLKAPGTAGTLTVTQTQVIIDVFGNLKTMMPTSVRVSDTKIDIQDEKGGLVRFYTNPERNSLVQRLSLSGPGFVFTRKPGQLRD